MAWVLAIILAQSTMPKSKKGRFCLRRHLQGGPESVPKQRATAQNNRHHHGPHRHSDPAAGLAQACTQTATSPTAAATYRCSTSAAVSRRAETLAFSWRAPPLLMLVAGAASASATAEAANERYKCCGQHYRDQRRFPPKHDPPDYLEVRGVGSDAVSSAGVPVNRRWWSRSLTTSPPITTLRVEGRRRRWAHGGQVRCGKCGPGLMLSSPP